MNTFFYSTVQHLRITLTYNIYVQHLRIVSIASIYLFESYLFVVGHFKNFKTVPFKMQNTTMSFYVVFKTPETIHSEFTFFRKQLDHTATLFVVCFQVAFLFNLEKNSGSELYLLEGLFSRIKEMRFKLSQMFLYLGRSSSFFKIVGLR